MSLGPRGDDLGSLPLGRGQLEIDYTLPAFTSSHRVTFLYRLAGLEKEWTRARERTAAVFTNLPPGTFTFQVAALIDGQDPSRLDNRAQVRFTLVPPFQRTSAFKALVAAALAGLVSFGMWARARTRRARAP